MEITYRLYGDDIQKYEKMIGSGEVIETEIMDENEKVWKSAKIKLFAEPVPDSEPVGLLGPFSEPYDDGKYHMRVVELLEEEDD